jgi:hypothetical protein
MHLIYPVLVLENITSSQHQFKQVTNVLPDYYKSNKRIKTGSFWGVAGRGSAKLLE